MNVTASTDIYEDSTCVVLSINTVSQDCIGFFKCSNRTGFEAIGIVTATFIQPLAYSGLAVNWGTSSAYIQGNVNNPYEVFFDTEYDVTMINQMLCDSICSVTSSIPHNIDILQRYYF